MSEDTKPVEEPKLPGDLRNVKALSIDITKILAHTADASTVNIYYVVTDGEVDIKGMEIIGASDKKVN